MLEPTLTVTGPDGEKALNKKTGVHPNTNFDQGGASGVSTPINSDTEADFMDIRRAQKMALTISPIHSTPEAHRVIRQIVRGQYSMFQREAEQGLRRQRVYLVATDLSEEAAYALEWTIGTVLRDGDTLLAVYAVDEETGTGGEASSVGIGEGASAVKDTASIVESFPKGVDAAINPFRPSVYSNAIPNPPTPDLSVMSKSERERYHAASKVSDRCVKLLRKTRLQVRVVVEVFHCKSPKHMITEVIDFLEPTLVILGSRGRSALKGVLLGSFSNYLVTKSSVPVMVARKRLKKHSKYRSTNVRLSNVITNPNHTSSTRFAHARVDEFDKVRPGSAEAERLERRKKKKEQELQEALALIPR
ncbi:adenine nucleotide alpha hydrolases-like protein [Viridothelium virens]|uniref:Adenine nucleotide alpha hydrolases-like protein n=1 Tax=Viridothelium virens TaxID=1048519 RepID=A0A6A6HM73_VIRVR|nr:adenine nucleotide alpha hydrolases-like protein [Viridothelium virens]